MPFGAVVSAIGAGVAGSVASTAIGAISSGLSGSSQSSDITAGLQQANALLSPYATTGTTAETQQANLLGLNGSDAATSAMSTFQADPSYHYQETQGLKAIDAGAASKGLLQSGGTTTAEETLGSNLANEQFSTYYNRLSGLASNGLTAATSEAKDDTTAAGSLASIDNATATGIDTSLQGGVSNLTQNALSSLGSGTSSASTAKIGTTATASDPFGGAGVTDTDF